MNKATKKSKKRKVLRKVGFVDYPEHFYYSVRKCSSPPWASK